MPHLSQAADSHVSPERRVGTPLATLACWTKGSPCQAQSNSHAMRVGAPWLHSEPELGADGSRVAWRTLHFPISSIPPEQLEPGPGSARRYCLHSVHLHIVVTLKEVAGGTARPAPPRGTTGHQPLPSRPGHTCVGTGHSALLLWAGSARQGGQSEKVQPEETPLQVQGLTPTPCVGDPVSQPHGGTC